MSALKTKDGIAPGKIMYHVYGTVLAKRRHKLTENNIDDHIERCIITSFPKYYHYSLSTRTDSLFVDCIMFGTMEEFRSGFSLKDCGIGNKKNYNLNRLFTSIGDAREFIGEIMAGKFFDVEEQMLYNEEKYYYDICNSITL